MGTNCAPLIADLFLFCYDRDFMMSLSDDKQADVIDAFITTSRYLDDISNINNVYFDNMVSQVYPSELQLNKANTSDTEAAFLDLHLSISNDTVSTKIYDKRDGFDFENCQFPILAWEFVTRSCLKPQNPCSNHEIRVLFEHGFYLKKPELGPDLHA